MFSLTLADLSSQYVEGAKLVSFILVTGITCFRSYIKGVREAGLWP